MSSPNIDLGSQSPCFFHPFSSISKNSWKEKPSVLRVFPASLQFTYTKMWSKHLAITPNLSLWRDLEILRLSFFDCSLFSVFSPSPERPQWAQELECQLPKMPCRCTTELMAFFQACTEATELPKPLLLPVTITKRCQGGIFWEFFGVNF